MCTNQNLHKHDRPSSRLPENVQPSFYEIKIIPDITNASFSGEETIYLKLSEPSSSIVLHAAELKITGALLSNKEGSSFKGSVSLDEEKQRAVISFDGCAGAGEWSLKLSFEGILNNKLRGFYRSSFKDASGNEKFIATTKFEPSDARRAFPCFDEPEFKSVFQISLLIDSNLNAISNSPVLSETDLGGGKKLIRFAPSIKMSSYLVAYVVGEFEASEPVLAKSGVPIRVWCVPGKRHLSGFALRWAKFSLDYFADYFNIDYPGAKLDLIAIPDFASGAMENFGAITFRETALLLDESKATHAELVRVAEVVSHENAHMWFGDLVTMRWWNGLWLNEAFATFMASKAINACKPEWKFWDSFNIEKSGAMRIDGLQASRSIEFPVASPEDARAMFDVLTYEKGCAILRMLELYIGEDAFRKGCASYMVRHAYANTETSDLWTAIEEAVSESGVSIPVGEMMNSWIFQQGYPLVSIEAGESEGCITLRQRPFLYLNGATHGQIWHVPVRLRAVTADGEQELFFALSKPEQSFYLGEQASSVVLNAGGAGFFRVAYSEPVLAAALSKPDKLSGAERFNLLSDLWAATLSGHLSVGAYLENLKLLLSPETDLNVFSAAASSITYLRRICKAAAPERLPAFAKLIKEILQPALDRLGWEAIKGESAQDVELRSLIIGTLSGLGEESINRKLAELWSCFLKDRSSVDSALLPAAIESRSANGDADCYEEMIRQRKSASTPQEESRFLFALTSFRHPELINRTLKSTLDGSVRVQDAPQMVRALFFNPEGGRATLDFVKENWAKITAAFPLQGVIRLCEGLTALIDPSMEPEIREFFEKNNVKGNEKALAQNLETLEIANQFLKREGAGLIEILSA